MTYCLLHEVEDVLDCWSRIVMKISSRTRRLERVIAIRDRCIQEHVIVSARCANAQLHRLGAMEEIAYEHTDADE